MITLCGFGCFHGNVISETRDLGAQWAIEETGLRYRDQALNHSFDDLDGHVWEIMWMDLWGLEQTKYR